MIHSGRTSRANPSVGMLAIELGVVAVSVHQRGTQPGRGKHVAIECEEAFPNCPKYINRRGLGPFVGEAVKGERVAGARWVWRRSNF
jgi:hypothetical protein